MEFPLSLQGHPGKRGALGDSGRQGKPVSVWEEGLTRAPPSSSLLLPLWVSGDRFLS